MVVKKEKKIRFAFLTVKLDLSVKSVFQQTFNSLFVFNSCDIVRNNKKQRSKPTIEFIDVPNDILNYRFKTVHISPFHLV